MRLTRSLPWLLFTVLIVFSVATYDSLPPQVPRHIDLGGRVQSAPRSVMNWSLVPVVALLMQLLMEGIRRLLPRRPDLFNFPGKEDLMKLPAEFHPPIVGRMQRVMDIAAALTMAIMTGVQVLMWHTARGGDAEPGAIALMLSGVIVTPLLFVVIQGVSNEVDAAKRRWENRRNPLAG